TTPAPATPIETFRINVNRLLGCTGSGSCAGAGGDVGVSAGGDVGPGAATSLATTSAATAVVARLAHTRRCLRSRSAQVPAQAAAECRSAPVTLPVTQAPWLSPALRSAPPPCRPW